MNVRIGNDIRLNLTLKGPRNYDLTNIKQLRAYLINTSMLDFDAPFEPCNCSNSGCRINACGKGGYFHSPSNFSHCCGDCGGCCCDYKYWLKPCKPFGPRPFWPHYNWWRRPLPNPGRVPFNVALVEAPLPPKYGPDCPCCDCGKHCHPWHRPCCHPHPGLGCGFCGDPAPMHINEDFRYLAPSNVLEGKNRIQVYFPACDQYACGVYKLVIVLVIYESGWGRCNLHTYTIDYGDIFTLVDDNTGASGDVTIDVDNDQILGASGNYIGFADSDSWRNVRNDILNKTTTLTEIDEIFGTHSLTLTGENKYLWIVSLEPIADGNSTNTLHIKTSLFDVPLTIDGQHDGLYFYHCPNPLTAESDGQTGDDVNIEFDITIEEK